MPDTFGLRYSPQEAGIPDGKLGYDAPANIGLMIVGWLFGENDFSKCICIAAGAGEDADCTAGTLAATFGIINGTKSIDPKWTDPIGDEIKTVAISRADPSVNIPDKVSQLTQRVVSTMRVFLNDYITVSEDGQLTFAQPGEMKKTLDSTGWMEKSDPFWYMYQKDLMAKKKNSLMEVYVMMDDLQLRENSRKELRLRFRNRAARNLWLNICVQMADGAGEVKVLSNTACWLNEWTMGTDFTDKTIRMAIGELKQDRCPVDILITANGFPTKLHIPLVLVKDDSPEEI